VSTQCSDPNVEDIVQARASAEAALKVVNLRQRQIVDGSEHPDQLITDAYATVAIAFRRAAATYTIVRSGSGDSRQQIQMVYFFSTAILGFASARFVQRTRPMLIDPVASASRSVRGLREQGHRSGDSMKSSSQEA
jgi:hypothetical protein